MSLQKVTDIRTICDVCHFNELNSTRHWFRLDLAMNDGEGLYKFQVHVCDNCAKKNAKEVLSVLMKIQEERAGHKLVEVK